MIFNQHLIIVDKFEKSNNVLFNHPNNENTYLTKNNDINNNLSPNKQFSDFIFELVEDFYKNTILNNLKPKEGEFNIFSSIILQNKNEYKLITFTSGTRSIPNKFAKEYKEFKIRDCHAEILSFRCLKSFLIKCLTFNYIIKLLSQNYSENGSTISRDSYTEKNLNIFLSYDEFDSFNANKTFFEIFEFFENSKIFLKENVYFHLYISETPCGDCSIYPLNNENFSDKEDYNQTGAKSIDEVLVALAKSINNDMVTRINQTSYLNEEDLNKNKTKNFDKFFIEHDNSKGKFRTKSMRSDIKKENISYSLSCSDKILFKNLFGIQGKILFKIMHPIYISSITISIKNTKHEIFSTNKADQNIKDAIKRGISLLRRNIENNLNLKFNKFSFNFNEPLIYTTEKHIFSFKNNISHNSNSNLIDKFDKENILLNDKLIQSFSIYWLYSKSDFSIIDPNSGFKQGTVMKKDKFNPEKCKLDICKLDFFIAFLRFLNLYSDERLKIENFYIKDSNKNIGKSNVFSNYPINKIIKVINCLMLSTRSKEFDNKSTFEINLLNQFSIWLNENSSYNKIKKIIFDQLGISEFLNHKNIQ